jgi:Holliday junction resolvase
VIKKGGACMSKPESIMIDDVVKTLQFMGYKTTKPRHINCNGVDIFAIKEDYVLSVEIKKAVQPKGNNVFRVRKVEINRQSDDLIAIAFPNGYVLVEPMKDHLKCCNKQGDRFLNY